MNLVQMFLLKFCYSRFDLVLWVLVVVLGFFSSEYNYSLKGFLAAFLNIKGSLDFISFFWRGGAVVF